MRKRTDYKLCTDNKESLTNYWGSSQFFEHQWTDEQCHWQNQLKHQMQFDIFQYKVQKDSAFTELRSKLDWSLKPLVKEIQACPYYRDVVSNSRLNLYHFEDDTLRVFQRGVRAFKANKGAIAGHRNYDPLVKAAYPHRTKDLAMVLMYLHSTARTRTKRKDMNLERVDPHRVSFRRIHDTALTKLFMLKGYARAGSLSDTFRRSLKARQELDHMLRDSYKPKPHRKWNRKSKADKQGEQNENE